MAQSGHGHGAEQCLLSGAKRTWLEDGVRSAYDPKRSLVRCWKSSLRKPAVKLAREPTSL
jgi:hypothetical protein